MSGRLHNKVAIITGASSGLGRAISLTYAKEGAIVVCADLQPIARVVEGKSATSATHDLINESGGKAIFVKCDVGESSDVQEVVRRAVEEFGRLDIMVNNAGIAIEASATERKPIWETSEETWDKTMRINSRGVFLGCKYAGAQMVKQEPHPNGDRGWIINLASILGLVGSVASASYCASKGSIINLTRAAALDFAPLRIHCNAICPGYIETPLISHLLQGDSDFAKAINAAHPFKGLGAPEDIAKVAVFLASEDASWVTGVSMPVDGGYTAR